MQQTKPRQSIGSPRSYALIAVLGTSMLSACAQDAERDARTHTVAIQGFQYAPTSITVALGDTVVWQNQDIVPHTATANGRGLDTGSIGPNASRQYLANTKGTYEYDCTFHPTMKGTLVIR